MQKASFDFRRSSTWIIVAVAVLAAGTIGFVPADVHAVGLLIPERDSMRPFDVERHNVTVEITNNAAETEVVQVFRNHTDRPQEAIFAFPLPKGSTVSDFSLWIDGEKKEGRVLRSARARHIYRSIVRRVRDPGLVEYMDGRLFRASIFPIPAGGTQKLKLEFTQVLERQGGMYRYRYPLGAGSQYVTASTEKHFALEADVRSPRPITAVYSPTHRIGVRQTNAGHVVVGSEKMHATLDRDFELFIGHSKREVGLNLMTYDPDGRGGRDGYFMAALAPQVGLEPERESPQAVTFVVDTSGSMNGAKLRDMQRTLKYCIGQLEEQDRFNVVRFATGVETLFPGLRRATDEIRGRGIAFADQLEAAGGTAIGRGLKRALDQEVPEEYVHHIVFVTDGIPTIGVTDRDTLLGEVGQRLQADERIFSFGVGYDVDTKLLDGLARRARGKSEYVEPDENLDGAVSALYTRITSPILSSIDLDFGSAHTYDVYPNPLPDLFRGDQVVLFGRYKGAFEAPIQVSGRAAGERLTFEFRPGANDRRSGAERDDASAAVAAADLGFIPELWATRKVGYLLEHIRLHGERPELKNEVVRLGKKFGLVTPYTSYLAVPDREEPHRQRVHRESPAPSPRPQAEASSQPESSPSGSTRRADPSAGESSSSTPPPRRNKQTSAESSAPHADRSSTSEDAKFGGDFQAESGSDAVRNAQQTDSLKRQKRVRAAPERDRRFVAGRTFVFREGAWIQTGLDLEKLRDRGELEVVEAYSKRYFELMRIHDDLAEIAGLGEHVVVELGGAPVEIVPEGR